MSTKTAFGKAYRITVQILCFSATSLSFIAGCAAQQVPSPKESPTNIPTTMLPSATNTLRPTTTPRPTPLSTVTPKPNTAPAYAVEFNVPRSCLSFYTISSDQDWIAGDCQLYGELILSNKTSGKQIQIRYKDIDPGFPENFSMRPLSWASDNRYLYFTTRCCNPDDRDNSNGALYRFDIDEHTWSMLIRAVYKPFYFFSPDGEKYVYLNHYSAEGAIYPEHLEIGMVDVPLNKNKRIVLQNYIGPIESRPEIKWSKSGNKFAVILNSVIYEGDSTWLDPGILIVDFNRWEMELHDDINFHTLFVTSEEVP